MRSIKYIYYKHIKPVIMRALFYYLVALVEIYNASNLHWSAFAKLLPVWYWEKDADHVYMKGGLVYFYKRMELGEYDRLPESAKKLLQKNWYCGYVRYPKEPFIFGGYPAIDSFCDYVQVHGGITFGKQDKLGKVYGFDCNHLDDEKRPFLQDTDWLQAEIHDMRLAIDIATRQGYETAYQTHRGQERVEIINEYLQEVTKAQANITPEKAGRKYSTFSMLNIMFGSP